MNKTVFILVEFDKEYRVAGRFTGSPEYLQDEMKRIKKIYAAAVSVFMTVEVLG